MLGRDLPLTGSYASPTANGRGTLSLNYGTVTHQHAYYIVNSALLLIVQADLTELPLGNGMLSC
jgi:hypothetical protein